MTDEVDVIDLNEADVNALSSLPGIGSTLAKRIVEFRQSVHPFEEVIELAAVTGISERMVRNLEGLVTVTIPTEIEGALAAADEGAMPIERQPAAEERAETEPEPQIEDDEVRLGDMAEAEAPSIAEEEEGVAVEGLEAVTAEAAAAPSPEISSEELEDRVVPQPTEPTGLEGAAPAPLLSVDQGKQARQRGCFVLIAGALLGALAGTALTLAILATINHGTLSFSDVDARLRDDLESANQTQNQLNDEFAIFDSRLADITNRTGETEQQQVETNQLLEDMQQTISQMRRDAASLAQKADLLEERITEVAVAAETFNEFLDGLRDLLFAVQGPPSTPTPTPSATASPGSAQPTSTPSSTRETDSAGTVEPEATATGAGQPTRTPRPTATPFALPTSTPEPQP